MPSASSPLPGSGCRHHPGLPLHTMAGNPACCHEVPLGWGWHPLAGAGSPLPEAMTSSPNPATWRCLHWSPAKLSHALSCPFPPSGPVASASRSSCPDSLSTLRKQLTLFLPRLLQQLGEPPPTPFSATRLLEPRLLLSLHQTSSSQTRGEDRHPSPHGTQGAPPRGQGGAFQTGTERLGPATAPARLRESPRGSESQCLA